MVRIARRLIILVLSFLLISANCFAASIGVIIDDKNIEFDVPPTLQNGRTLVPVRKIFEELDCDVEWLGESQTVIATQNSKIIALRIGINRMIRTDIETGISEVFEIDVPPIVQNGRTLVPVRVISEALNYFVDWDAETNMVIIKTQ